MPISHSDLKQIVNPYSRLIIYIHDRQPSNITLIVGRRGTGKTSKILSAMEILNQYDIIHNFATNIKVYDTPFNIEPIANLDDLILWGKNTQGKKLYGFDEVGGAWARRTPMSSLNVNLLKSFQRIRKYKMSTIATTISEDYVDNALLGEQILDGIVRCPNWKNPRIALYDDFLEGFHKDFKGIHDTSIHFDTWDSAPFQEHSQTLKPKFKDRELEVCWEWSHGKTAKDLGLHSMQLNRILRKFIKEVTERDSHASQVEVREDIG